MANKAGNWSQDEEKLLREKWGILTPKDIAHKLGRHAVAVYSKARGMGLVKNENPKLSAKRKAGRAVSMQQVISDPEAAAISDCVNVLRGLRPDQIRRVLSYLATRFRGDEA